MPLMDDTNADNFDDSYMQGLAGDPSSWHRLVLDEHSLIMDKMPPKPHERILDIGCGSGRLEKFLALQESTIDMVSADISPESKKYIRGEFVQCSMTDLPFQENSFDKVFCQQVLAHFRDGGRGIEEAFRVLKKGGKLMILTPNIHYVMALRIASSLHLIPSIRSDGTARWLYSRRTLRRLFNTRPWSRVELTYFQKAPGKFPMETLRPKIVAVATK
jgi:ubiquinone/menaquinone biosynthesis C-methylase UbiE